MKKIIKFVVIPSIAIMLLCMLLWYPAMNNPKWITVREISDVGQDITFRLKHHDAFPRDGRPMDFAEFCEGLRQGDTPSRCKKQFYDQRIWTVVKNIPTNPPANMIVLVTLNVDASSLRTHLTDDDMHKSIRLVNGKISGSKNMTVLKKGYAALIRADGSTVLVNKRTPWSMTYEYIYGSTPFDASTNPDGTQVKYIMPDGIEVVPNNDDLGNQKR